MVQEPCTNGFYTKVYIDVFSRGLCRSGYEISKEFNQKYHQSLWS